jgi:hypothetical protein
MPRWSSQLHDAVGAALLGSSLLGSSLLGPPDCGSRGGSCVGRGRRDHVPPGLVVRLRILQVRCHIAAIEEFTKAPEQVLPAQPEEARDQLGEDRAKRGRNTEDKGQSYGNINDP